MQKAIKNSLSNKGTILKWQLLVFLMVFGGVDAKSQKLMHKALGNLSFSVSYGFNYYFDNTKTIYYDEIASIYRLNEAKTFNLSYHLNNGIIISAFSEEFNGVYQDWASLYRDDIIFQRHGHNYGLRLAYTFKLSKKWSLMPSIGLMKRKGYEMYYFYRQETESRINDYYTVALNDLGITPGLSLSYTIGKGFSVFGRVDYTRFEWLRSSNSGLHSFKDRPTTNYLRTRLGLQYALSHILKKED